MKTPDKEPKRCTNHPAAVAIWHVAGRGYCFECKDAAYRAAAGYGGRLSRFLPKEGTA